MDPTRIILGTAIGLRTPDEVVVPSADVVALESDGDTWWFLDDGSAVCRLTDGSVERVAELGEGPGRSLLASPDGLLVGLAGGHLARLSDGAVEPVDEFDSVAGRDRWYTPWGGPPDTRSLSIDVDGTVYANVHVGGIVRGRTGTWEPTVDIDTDVHQVISHPSVPGRVLAAAAVGLLESDDGADTWRTVTDGLHETYSRAVAVSGDNVLMTSSGGPRGSRAAVYRRPIEGGQFHRCTEGLPEWFVGNIDSHCLAADGDLVVFSTHDGVVYASDDGGGVWEQVGRGLPEIRCVGISPAG